MTTQIERNAQMVADLAISDWRMAYVIACSAVSFGRNGKTLDRSADPDGVKVSIGEFARMVKDAAGGRVYGVGKDGISKTLDRWDSLYGDESDWQRGNLRPEDANLEVEFPNESFRSLTDTGKGAAASTKRDIAANPGLVAEVLSENPSLLDEIIENVDGDTLVEIAVAADREVESRGVPKDEQDKAKERSKQKRKREKDNAGGAYLVMEQITHIHTALNEIDRVARMDISTADRQTLTESLNAVELHLAEVRNTVGGNAADWDAALVALQEG